MFSDGDWIQRRSAMTSNAQQEIQGIFVTNELNADEKFSISPITNCLHLTAFDNNFKN